MKKTTTPTTKNPSGPDMRRAWRAELKQVRADQRRVKAEIEACTRMASKAIARAQKGCAAFVARVRRAEASAVRGSLKQMAKITTRAQILEGRLS